MDGYAIHSEAAKNASPQTPVMFKVLDTIKAGDDPIEILRDMRRDCTVSDSTSENQCLEIMTGPIFPEGYDACVKIEDTMPYDGPGEKYVVLTKPVPCNANRRLAWSDILKDDVVIQQGAVVQPSHVLALASVGVDLMAVTRRPIVGIWSTGKEIANGKGATCDANGPYLTAATKDLGLRAEFLGILDDDPNASREVIQNTADSVDFDILITSGAVSKGKFDHLRDVLEQMGADIVFHGLGIRPGNPVLFGMLPRVRGRTAFFGSPGNSGAAAACFRFFVVPYIRALLGQPTERPTPARLVRNPTTTRLKHGCHPMQDMDCFRHCVVPTSQTDQLIVEPSPDQCPAKLGPFTTANCWIHLLPDRSDKAAGPTSADMVECYPLSATGSIHLSNTAALLN
ncbi:hypothetical protein VTG60DRAFT_3320 [Thermothelomyces hinnuleus]